MRRAVYAVALLPLVGCAAAEVGPSEKPQPNVQSSSAAPVDDGTYLSRIDPVGGQWFVDKIGDKDLSRVEAWVHFSAGGFLNHGAGCGGGHPAFYRLDGGRVSITRLEPVEIGKCPGDTAAERSAAAESERLLASFIDGLAAWSRQGDVLMLTSRDGTRATLTKPVDPNPEISGRWLIESIGGKPLVTDRPATVEIRRGHIGAYADCNRMSSQFTIPAPGRISVSARMLATEKGCVPEDEAEDALIARAIKGATAYRVAGDRLIFTGGPGMVVRRPPPPDRRLAGEYEACGSTMLGAYHEGPITLAISESGMRDNAGCSARYVANGPDLDVRLTDTPACKATAPPYAAGQSVGVGGNISVLALWRPDGFGFNDEGQLVLRTKRSHMTMCRKGAPRTLIRGPPSFVETGIQFFSCPCKAAGFPLSRE